MKSTNMKNFNNKDFVDFEFSPYYLGLAKNCL